MNTDPSRPGETPADQPVLDGAGLRPVEDRLRRSLDAEASTITPTDRLGAILADAHAGTGIAGRRASRSSGPGSRHHRWIVPAAAAAAAVLVAGTVWAVNRPPAQTPPVAATPTAVETSTPRSRRATPSSGRSSVPTQTAAQPTTPAPPATTARPATGDDDRERARLLPRPGRGGQRPAAPLPRVRLRRPGGTRGPAGNAVAALRLAMGPAPAGSGLPLRLDRRHRRVGDAGDAAITVRLSSGTRDATPLAAEQLVWTVQAALGSALPVRFVLADGGADVAPGHAASTSFTRPSDPMAVLDQVAPIWVDEPARGSVVKAGAPLTVKGVASTFEATVEWELLRGGEGVDHGVTTASRGAPARGTYTFPTKPLTAGDYVLRVFESSAQDGSTVAEQRVPFTAR